MAEIKANKILLVEDEFNIAKLFVYNLTKAGYECEVASNGREGYEKTISYRPDLIISDVMMPEVDGYEFRKMLLQNDELKKIPFVFLTAKGEEDDILQGYDLEIEDYILKTSSPKIVLAKVSAILKTLEKERSKVVDEVSKAADSMGVKVVPEEFPVFEGFEIKHWHQPHKNVPGGDFIDYIKIDNDNIVVVLGDTMGKRWGAWYFAVAYAGYVRSATRFVLEATKDYKPSIILQKVNESVFKDERISDVFITLSIVIINKTDKTARYSGAGDLPLFLKTEKEVTPFLSNGLLLGFSESGEYQDHELKLESGNEIFLVTDGITEARNSNGEMFREEGFIDFLKSVPSNIDTLEALKLKMEEFTAGNYDDDVSVINIKVL
ncbi:MAG: SpoIIE family protein phosphatase [Stygiobacter sp.]|uniref:SpoIIE family protein phosphatase n=1 Tax=Stygiobacter electus TaxID=3032292 RepID=A0AAE3P092_9BACT|nr:SpoIIE family protein phosphatase [Stygiobacter electus]MDF1612014.1 SpoIIE family protein phosphatase [Stygiobacter electus]